jgi:hypothetical protein
MCLSGISGERFLRIHDLDFVILVNLPISHRSSDLSPDNVSA